MAKQADSRSIIPAGAAVPLAERALQENAAAEFLTDKPAKTIIMPVANDRWSPTFNCGDFLVVDVGDRQPVEDAFFLIRHSGGDLALVKLCIWTRANGRIVGARRTPKFVANQRTGEQYWDGFHWSILYGLARMMPLDGSQGETYMAADGPLPDRHMRQQCVGRVIGALGKSHRAVAS